MYMKTKYLKQIERNIKYIIPISIVVIACVYMYSRTCQEGFETNPTSFEKDTQNGKKLVLFYADWCGHCKTIKPEWNAAAAKVNKNGNNKMIKINVGDAKDENQQQISNAYNIQGYPTILYLDSGKKIDTYKDGMDETSFVSRCKNF